MHYVLQLLGVVLRFVARDAHCNADVHETVKSAYKTGSILVAITQSLLPPLLPKRTYTVGAPQRAHRLNPKHLARENSSLIQV